MKRTNWLVLKLMFILAGLVLIYNLDLSHVSAQGDKCNTTQACTSTWSSCHCGDSDCGGCYIPNGQGGCGTCAKGSESESD